MNTKQFIKETLAGFDYSKREKTRLAKELYAEITKMNILGWEKIYEFVTEKLDRLNTPSQDLRANDIHNGLDVVVMQKVRGKKISRHDLVGRKDSSIDQVVEDPITECKSISLKDAINLVKNELDKRDYRFLKDLSSHVNGNIFFPTDSQEIIDSLNRVKESVKWVAQAFYDECEGLVIPGKIRVISSDPLEVRVGQLNQEKVARVYEAHERDLSYAGAAKYAGVSESTVKRLWDVRNLKSKHNKLEGKPIKRVDEETRKKIFEAHEQGMSYNKAGEYAGVSFSTVRNYWQRAGLKAHGARVDGKKGTDPIAQEKIGFIIKCHKEGKGSWETARLVGVSSVTVVRYWKLAGIKVTPAKNHLSREEINRIVDLSNQGKGISEIKRVTGSSRQAVEKYVNAIDSKTGQLPESTYNIKPSPRRGYKPEQIREILQAHTLFDGNIAEAARNLPYNYISIRRHWLENGLRPLRNSGKSVLDKKKKEQIVDAYETYQGITKEAAKKISLPAVLVSRVWRDNGLKPRIGSEKWRPPQQSSSSSTYNSEDLSKYTLSEIEAIQDLKEIVGEAKQIFPHYALDQRSKLGKISTNKILEELEERLLSPYSETSRLNVKRIYSFVDSLRKSVTELKRYR